MPRIVSLLPSATEIVCALGAGEDLVGITHECDFPPEVIGKPRLTRSIIPTTAMSSLAIDNAVDALLRAGHSPGSIYHIEAEVLRRAAPDVILTQQLCDVCAVSFSDVQRTVASIDGACRIESIEPGTIGEILASILRVGTLIGAEDAGRRLVDNLSARLERVRAAVASATDRPSVCCVEWLEPPFGAGHWVPEQVRIAGGVEVFDRVGLPSLRTTWDLVIEQAPEVVVLLPCGFDLEGTLREVGRTEPPAGWEALPAVRNGRVYATDGSAYFSRPGPRVVDGVEILGHILHPDLVPPPPMGRMAHLAPGTTPWS